MNLSLCSKHFNIYAFSILMILILNSCITEFKIPTIANSFNHYKHPAIVDYSLTQNWAALPSKLDASDSVPLGLNKNLVDQKADVFFIHPTLYVEKPDSVYAWNADVNNLKLNNKVDASTILYQASVFNGAGQVYAPRYRQAHIYAFYTPHLDDKWASLDLAYIDIKNAFEYYLKHYYHGQPIIIAGHSQGTIHAYWLLRDYFKNTELRKHLVAAYLIGMPIPKDSLAFLLPCADSTQTNCYLAWNTFKWGYTPTNYSIYENTDCINPLSWQLTSSYVSRKNNEGSVLFGFKKVLKHRVDAYNTKNILWIHKPKILLSIFYVRKNYHTGDYNLFYQSVRNNVACRLKQYYKLN